MNFTFDHLVHFVEDPKKAMERLSEKGIVSAQGGRHENRGTYNVLSYFDLSYIELLSTYDKELVKQTDHPPHSFLATVVQDQFREGFSRIAIRTTNIEKAAWHFLEKGLIVNGPESFSRKRPDGSTVEWQLLYIGSPYGGLELPFIIQWTESDEERRMDLMEKRAIQPHPSDVVFSHVTVAVSNLKETVHAWSEWLGLAAGELYTDEELQAECQSLELGGGRIVFSMPTGTGLTEKALRQQGEGPFMVTLSSSKSQACFELFGGIYNIVKV